MASSTSANHLRRGSTPSPVKGGTRAFTTSTLCVAGAGAVRAASCAGRAGFSRWFRLKRLTTSIASSGVLPRRKLRMSVPMDRTISTVASLLREEKWGKCFVTTSSVLSRSAGVMSHDLIPSSS
ncbi:hypothetical protein PsorP6_013638 [Peronosclerospora sorghi]|uniref:Uncharacterized protein n=1 Tax=Peronosclerospora sorghi TaxID=230839 RepID=A0ACC0VIH8_9STRA|nr:hypothetical protein PsorP6_013638 [Peronosclerospora sorghi]